MAATRISLIAALEQTAPALERLTAALSDEALDFHPAPQDWSIREVLAHFVDDEMYVMRLRLERIVKEERPHLAPHDEKAWYASRNTTRDHLNDLLADFALQRAASLGMLKMLRESDWMRQGYQPEYDWFTAAEWLERWVEHDAAHLRQIEYTLSAYQQAQATN
jgi:hypothetical protein